MNVPAAPTPRQYTAPTDTQLWALDRWAVSDFEADYRPDAQAPETLGAQGPGGLTRWMAVPWRTDTANCRSGYDKTYDAHIPPSGPPGCRTRC